MFWVTFLSSLLSSTFGIANYLRSGPCRLLPKEKNLGGFPLLFLSVGTCMVGKGMVFYRILNVKSWHMEYLWNMPLQNQIIGYWILTNIVPQLIYVCINDVFIDIFCFFYLLIMLQLTCNFDLLFHSYPGSPLLKKIYYVLPSSSLFWFLLWHWE